MRTAAREAASQRALRDCAKWQWGGGVKFSHSVLSDSLWTHGLHHARPPCPSPIPGVYSNSCLFSRWCHPTILSSVVPISLHLQSFPASGSFPMSQFFTSGGQSIGISVSSSVPPMNIQDWFPLGLTGMISLQSKRLKSLLQQYSLKAPILRYSAFFMVQHSYPWLLEKPDLWLYRPFLEKWCLCFLICCLGLS